MSEKIIPATSIRPGDRLVRSEDGSRIQVYKKRLVGSVRILFWDALDALQEYDWRWFVDSGYAVVERNGQVIGQLQISRKDRVR